MSVDEQEDQLPLTEAPCRLSPTLAQEIRLMLARLAVRRATTALRKLRRESSSNE
jgi:hypothetical protein